MRSALSPLLTTVGTVTLTARNPNDISGNTYKKKYICYVNLYIEYICIFKYIRCVTFIYNIMCISII